MVASQTMGDLWVSFSTAVDHAFTPEWLSAGVEYFSTMVGVTSAEVRLFLVLLAAYPIAFAWRQLPGPTARHWYSVLVGFWVLSFINGYQWVFNLASGLLCYAVMRIGGPKSARTVAFLAMALLAAGHLYRQYTDYLGWTLDWTMQQMIITQKVHALAYNYRDGNNPKATDEQKARSTTECPSLLEFLSFILFPANVAIGPTFEYRDYIAFAEGEVVSPSPFLPAVSKLVQGLVLFVLHQLIAMNFPCFTLLASEEFFKQGTFFQRYVIIWIALLGVRFKYYFGWKIAEGACCTSGLGYNGIDKETGLHKWDRVSNVDVFRYEFSQSLRTSSQSWNKTTNLWLRRYVYDRCPRSYNLYFSYLVSAFWHGFYPGYYMFFLSVAVASSVHRNIRRKIRPRFMVADGKTPGPYKFLYDIASVFATTLTLNYFIMSFVMLSFELAVGAFRGFRYTGHIVLAVATILFNTGLIRTPKPSHAKTS